MQVRTKLGLQHLLRARQFLATRELRVAVGDLAPHIEALDALVQRLEGHATEQSSRHRRARVATDTKQALGRTLRLEYLRPISYVARGLFARDHTVRKAFDLPGRPDEEGLVQVARAFATEMAKHLPLFVAKGFAPDIVERLEKATEAFRQAQIARGAEVGKRAAASQGMLTELAEGRRLIRVIDAMLAPRLADQPEHLAEWRTMSRLVRRAADNGAPPLNPQAPEVAAPVPNAA